MDKKKDSIIKFLKIAISLGLMFYLLKQTNWVDIGNTLKNIQIKYFLYGSIFPVFIIPVMAAIRWKILLTPGKIKISLIDIIKLSYTGLFFNLVFPGSVGGDTIKGVIFYRLTKNSSLSASSIFLDRIIGLFALAILSVISSSIYYKISSDNSFLLVAAFLLSFLIIFLGLSLITSIQKNFLFCLKWLKLKKIEEFMKKNLEFLSWFKKNPKILIATILISLFCHTASMLSCYIIGLSLNIEISGGYYFLFFPLIALIFSLPISISGLGVRESAFVYFFHKSKIVDVSRAASLSLSLLYFFSCLLASLLGGIIYLSSDFSKMKLETENLHSDA